MSLLRECCSNGIDIQGVGSCLSFQLLGLPGGQLQSMVLVYP